LAASQASSTFTVSPISQSRSVTSAAIAGVAAAEFLPADPALWVKTAIDANLRFGRYEGELIVDNVSGGDARSFLLGLYGTVNGREAVHDFMAHR